MRTLMKQFGWDEPYIPMNVKNSEGKLDKLFADDNYIAELKRDGNRYTTIGGRFFSRKPVEKTDNIPHLANFFSQFPDTVIEGEIYFPQKKSNHVTSIMGSDRTKALLRQGFGEFGGEPSVEGNSTLLWREDASEDWQKVDKIDKDFEKHRNKGKIKFCIFEITYARGIDLRNMSWDSRRAYLEAFYEAHVEGTIYAEYIILSTAYEGESSKRALLKWAEENDEEGIVLKNRNSDYKCDKRPEHYWYRVKGKITADVVVMGYEPPEKLYDGKELENWQYWEDDQGRIQIGAHYYGHLDAKHISGGSLNPVTKFYAMGWIGSVQFGLLKDGVLTHAGTCSGMDEAVREDFTTHGDSYIGKVIEITAMERTEKGLFRHPQFEQFRLHDKNPEECLWDVEVGE